MIFSKDPLVDLAIIMDNSGSLAEEQEGIQNNLETLVNQLDKGGTSCGQLGTVWNSFHSIDRTIPASSGSKCSGSIVVLS